MGIASPRWEELTFPEALRGKCTLRLDAWSSVSVSLRMCGFTKVGPFELTLIPTTNRVGCNVTIDLNSAPLYLNAGVFSGSPLVGQTYCRVCLFLGTVTMSILTAGYVTPNYALCWPPNIYEHSLDVSGALRSILGTDPSAGNEISETVPTGARWKLKALNANLVTSSTAANRYVDLIIDDGTNVLFRSSLAPVQTATLTYSYFFILGSNVDDAAFDAWGSLRKYISIKLSDLFAGWRIRTSTLNLQTTDDWGAPRLFIEELIE